DRHAAHQLWGGRDRGAGEQGKVVVHWHLLPPNLGGGGAQESCVKVPLVHHGQRLAVLVEDLDPLHVGNAQRAGYQVLQQCQVAGEHRIFGVRCQLVGNQLAGGLHFLSQRVQPNVGEEGHQQHAEQGG